MELREKTLKNIEDFFIKESSEISSICFFMQNLRLFLEIEDLKKEYIYINHYCNWILHKNLDQGLSPNIIKNIGNCFETFENKFDFINKISSSISVKQLIIEIKEVLYKNEIGFNYDKFIENENFWISFIQNIFNELKKRPILLTEKKKIIPLKIDGFDTDFSIYGIQLVEIKNKIVIEILSDELENQNKNFYIDFIISNEK